MVAAKCLLRAIDAASGWKSLSKLRYFQPATSSPFRVLHQPQGDKPKKHISSATIMEYKFRYLFEFLPDAWPMWTLLSWYWHGSYIPLLTKCFLCLSPWRGCELSERGWWEAFGLGIKSLLLYVQNGRMSPGALPPFSSRGFYGFCFLLMILRAKGSQEESCSCRKDKNRKNPLQLLQNVSCEPLMLRPVENPWASSDIFSRPHHHPIGFCISRKAINKKNTLP